MESYASWGYFDGGASSGGGVALGDYADGYQLVPVNWGINTPVKEGFFRLLGEITGAQGSGDAAGGLRGRGRCGGAPDGAAPSDDPQTLQREAEEQVRRNSQTLRAHPSAAGPSRRSTSAHEPPRPYRPAPGGAPARGGLQERTERSPPSPSCRASWGRGGSPRGPDPAGPGAFAAPGAPLQRRGHGDRRAGPGRGPGRDRARARGSARGDLHGIPYGAKDLLAARGAPTTWGAPPYRDQVFDADATVVQRLGRAGAVLAASWPWWSWPEAGATATPRASLQGPGRTPWNPGRWAGGSSSGSGDRRAGLVPYAIGSETSGSIVTPASFCGVTGLRPTYGLVSRHGAMPLSWTLDKLGPMARSADCCARVLQAIAGRDRRATPAPPGAPSVTSPCPLPPCAACAWDSPRRTSTTWPRRRPVPPSAPPWTCCGSLGAPRAEVGIPPGLAPTAPWWAPSSGPRGRRLRPLDRERGLPNSGGREAEGGPPSSPWASRRGTTWTRCACGWRCSEAFGDLFRGVDVLVGVGRPGPASLLDEPLDRGPAPRPAAEPDDRPANPALIPAGNLAGLPALSLPCGFTPPGRRGAPGAVRPWPSSSSGPPSRRTPCSPWGPGSSPHRLAQAPPPDEYSLMGAPPPGPSCRGPPLRASQAPGWGGAGALGAGGDVPWAGYTHALRERPMDGRTGALIAELSTVCAIPVTPFGPSGEVDWEAYGAVVERIVAGGVTVVTPQRQHGGVLRPQRAECDPRWRSRRRP